MAEPAALGDLLRRTLDAQGLSQAELARHTGISTKHLNQILQGDVPLSAECAVKIGRAVGIPAEVWLTLQALHQVQAVAEVVRTPGEPITPKLRKQRDSAQAEVARLRRLGARIAAEGESAAESP